MEDILASIRRILSDDEAPPGSAPGGSVPMAVEEPDDLLELDASMLLAPEPEAPPPLAVPEPVPEPVFELPGSAEPEPVFAPPEPLSVFAPAPPDLPDLSFPSADLSEQERMPVPMQVTVDDVSPPPPDLLSPAVAAAALGTMGRFMRNLESERQTSVYRGGPTLEDLVREEMRPLLKSWLDSNLPDMVERIVRSEIERLAGRVA